MLRTENRGCASAEERVDEPCPGVMPEESKRSKRRTMREAKRRHERRQEGRGSKRKGEMMERRLGRVRRRLDQPGRSGRVFKTAFPSALTYLPLCLSDISKIR